MASNFGKVTPNQEVRIKTEKDDAEINAMALKLKEIYRKNALAAARQMSASPAKVYTNKANRTVALIITSAIKNDNNTPKNNEEELLEHCEDIESRKFRFSWKSIAGFHVPYIIRLINGEYLKFVSTRMAETHLLSNYLHHLHSDIYTSCTSVNCHFITDPEAKLLNDINYNHTNCVYGKEIFFAGKDFIAPLEDVHEFYTFIEVCYKKLLCNITPDHNEVCGFIRINSESVVPYCIKNGQKYVPLFYFEGETENLINRAIKLENWNLSYLKFCCKVQGIRNELFASDSCTVARLNDIKKYFPPDTSFEEYWPAKVVDTYLLTNQKSTHVSSSCAWIRKPPEVVPPKNTISHTLPAPVIPQTTPVIMTTHQNGWPPNQMVNSYSTHAQPTSTTRAYSMVTDNQNMAAHCYNTFSMDSRGSTMSQSNISLNGIGHVLPPPLVHVGSTTPVIGQYLTTIYNPMTNSNVMSYSNQIRQVYSQRAINNSQPQQQLQQQQQQIITTHQTQQSYSGQPVYGRFTNTQQRNTLRNIGPIITTEIIDLSTPPSSPIPSPEPETFLRPNVGWELTRIPERTFLQGSSTSAAYKIQKTTLQGQTIHCINAKPYIYSDLMVTLEDLVQMMLPLCTIERCAHILKKYLKTTLFSGNSEQLAVLQDNGRLRSMYPEDTPMAMLQDIVKVFLQLRTLVSKSDDEIQQFYQYTGVLSKRQRTS
ncbi:uncharacterized protein LOC132934356 [Metopolophium dirhodum]|uniref:uncharacterized protein LOC132934356 n=1 Tax=Metopolophium dirhodum TaxID=44670 RepID=UPI00298F5413|nr:uncharacterized protein LOC132934356 [Metopolophium dirhodum]